MSELAAKTRAPRELVQRMYDEEMAELESSSTVKTFIEVIAGNRVRQRLGNQSKHTRAADDFSELGRRS